MLDDKNISEKINVFIDSIDKKAKESSKTVKEIIEKGLEISYDELTNLYVLKYHIEKEEGEARDKAIRFINCLIDSYSRGSEYKLESIRSVAELFQFDISDSEKDKRLLKLLQDSSGVIKSPYSSMQYEHEKLVSYTKDIFPEEDGSFLYQVSSNAELEDFKIQLFERFSHMFGRDRGNNIKGKIEALLEAGEFDNNPLAFICVVSMRGENPHFMLNNKKISLVGATDVFQDEELEIAGFPCQVWLI